MYPGQLWYYSSKYNLVNPRSHILKVAEFTRSLPTSKCDISQWLFLVQRFVDPVSNSHILLKRDMTMDFSGYQFRHYRLMNLLGQGGCANVYRAWDMNLRRWVAIKVLHNHVTLEQRDAFLKEARLMASMNHHHILPVLDFDTYGSIPYLVLPYVPHSLYSLYPHGMIVPLDKIISYVWQIAHALFYIHRRGYVHQDVKPANILLNEDDEVLVGDFGIVTVIRNTGSQGNQEIIGSIIYMAPERFIGRAYPVSDQYSLAVIVYEWMTGRYPFTGTSHQVMWQHLNARPSTRRMSALGIPPAVQGVLLRALEKDPRNRYNTVLEFADALEQAIYLSSVPEQEDERDEEQTLWQKIVRLFMGATIGSLGR